MYDLLYDIIGHVWNSGTGYNTTEQQLIVSGAIILVIVLTVVIIDFLYRLIHNIFKSR